MCHSTYRGTYCGVHDSQEDSCEHGSFGCDDHGIRMDDDNS
jgi:hypothetical protein